MRVLIAARLFLAVFGIVLLIGLVSQWLLNRALQQGFAQYVAQVEQTRLQPLISQLSIYYQQQQTWPQLDECQQRFWLGQQMMRADFPQFAKHLSNIAPTPPDQPCRPPMMQMREKPPQQAGFTEHEPPDFRTHDPERPLMADKGKRRERRLNELLFDRVGLYDLQGRHVAGVERATHEVFEQPIVVGQRTVGTLILLLKTKPNDALSRAFFADQQRQLWIVGSAALLLSALAAAVLARHFRRPIRELMQTAQALTARQFGQRTQINRTDELGQLGESINQLAHMLDAHEKAQQQWVSDTSHELRTPVAVLQAQVEAMQDGVRQATPEHLAAMQRQIGQLIHLIGDLQALSQVDAGQLRCVIRPLEMDAWLAGELDSFSVRMEQAGLKLDVDLQAASVYVYADAQRVQQVLHNILENSARYTDRGGVVRVSSRVSDGRWHCVIEDSAPSVAPELLSRLGERFFRVDASRQRATGGSGLGLAVSRQLVLAQDGELRFDLSALGGIAVSISLPLVT